MGEIEKGAEYSAEAIRVEPNHFVNYGNLAAGLLALGRTQEARRTIEQALTRKLDNGYIRLNLYSVAFVHHANPAVHEFGAEDSSEMDDRGLACRDGRGCRHPLRAPTEALMITDEPCLSSGKAF
jgi:hypothetical protein